MIKTAVIGVGNLGQHHARVYTELQDCRLIGVVDADGARARDIARKHKCDFFTDPKDLLGLVDAVSIVVPTAGHFDIAAEFLRRGVHCLLEKPMTETLEQADALLAIAEKSGAVIQVGHIERFNPAIRAIQNHKGQPLFIEAHRMGPYNVRNTDTGVVLDLMIHDLDIVQDLVGRPVVSVEAVGIPVLSHTEDIANVRPNFEGGCVANLTASRVTTSSQRKIRIFTREAYLSVDYLKREVKVYRLKEGADPSQASSLIGLSKMVAIETLPIRDGEQLKLELESFISAIKNGEHPEVTGRHGRMALDLGLQVQAKLAEHRRQILG